MRASGYEIFSDNGTLVVRNSDSIDGSDSLDDILAMLRFSGKNVVRVVWHLDEFAAPVIRKLPVKNLAELASTRATVFNRYRIYYIPGYLFQVGGAGERFGTSYFGIKQFLNIPGFPPTPPMETVEEMGQEILDAIDTIGIGGNSVRLTSAGAVFQASDIGKKFMKEIPLGYHLPPQLIVDLTRLSALADDKYWVETRAIGSWNEGEVWDYDLTAAFINQAARLFDLRDLTFWRSDTIGKRERGALYGMVAGRFYIYPDGEYRHASPIITVLPNGLQGTAVGMLDEDCYSLEEVRTVERYGIGEFIPTGGGIFAHTLTCTPPRLPYKEMMEWLYGQRRWSDMAGRISKVAGNAVVGLMIERRDDAIYRNRFYHALITCGTRCAITRFLCDNDVKSHELLAIQTDGVKLSRNIPLPNGKKMGTWRNNGSLDTIIHSGHRVFVGDKRPGQVDINDVKRLIAEHPNVERYSKRAYRYTPMREALDAGDVSKVGEYVPFPVYFDLVRMDMEQTWYYPKLPKTGKELMERKYYSEPMVMGV